jgi:serine/threonine protein kinase
VELEGNGFKEQIAKQLFLQVLDATEYLHQNSIVHR